MQAGISARFLYIEKQLHEISSDLNWALILTHSYRKTLKRVIGAYVAPDQGLHCLLTGFSIKNRIKVTK